MVLNKKLKLPLLLIILAFSMLFIVACSSNDTSSNSESDNGNESSDEKHVLRFAHVLSEDTPLHLAAEKFKEDLEEKSDGRIEVELFPNGQLFASERESIEAVQLGNVEMSQVATAVMSSFQPEFSVYNLPFLFESREHVYAAMDGQLGDTLNESLADLDLIGTGYQENGFRHVLNNQRSIEKPEDISGLKMRVIENKMYEDLFNSLGANASPLGFGETYTALQQGVYDGLDSEITVASNEKFDEVLDYLSLTGHTFTATVGIMNKDYYDSLPEDLQDLVMEAAADMNEYERELNVEQEDDKLEKLKESMEVNELTAEQKKEFQKAIQPIFDEHAEKVGKDIVELAKEAKNN
ncbi:TRAP transporter substrate-binding protein [Virgibacillus sp. W0181]|uniref:TRAP transporter substrate-binding protein n=1 Tax=Virgibacillus sp. W0181 TaxID=3391581 RepID=UPI003F449807